MTQLLYPDKGPRVCFVGWGRSGKDEAAAALHNQGRFKFCGSTSWQALPFVAEALHLPPQVAWDTRHQNRKFWYDYCNWLRRDDPCFLIRLALEAGNIVSGIRDIVEIRAAQKEKLFDSVVWFHRPGTEVDPTVTFDESFADEVLVNDGTVEEWRIKIRNWAFDKGYLDKVAYPTGQMIRTGSGIGRKIPVIKAA